MQNRNHPKKCSIIHKDYSCPEEGFSWYTYYLGFTNKTDRSEKYHYWLTGFVGQEEMLDSDIDNMEDPKYENVNYTCSFYDGPLAVHGHGLSFRPFVESYRLSKEAGVDHYMGIIDKSVLTESEVSRLLAAMSKIYEAVDDPDMDRAEKRDVLAKQSKIVHGLLAADESRWPTSEIVIYDDYENDLRGDETEDY